MESGEENDGSYKTCCFKAKTTCIHSKSAVEVGFVAICQSTAAIMALLKSYSWTHFFFSQIDRLSFVLKGFFNMLPVVPFPNTCDGKRQRNTFENHAQSQHVAHVRCLCRHLSDRTSRRLLMWIKEATEWWNNRNSVNALMAIWHQTKPQFHCYGEISVCSAGREFYRQYDCI